jgi:hypothetical protein
MENGKGEITKKRKNGKKEKMKFEREIKVNWQNRPVVLEFRDNTKKRFGTFGSFSKFLCRGEKGMEFFRIGDGISIRQKYLELDRHKGVFKYSACLGEIEAHSLGRNHSNWAKSGTSPPPHPTRKRIDHSLEPYPFSESHFRKCPIIPQLESTNMPSMILSQSTGKDFQPHVENSVPPKLRTVEPLLG